MGAGGEYVEVGGRGAETLGCQAHGPVGIGVLAFVSVQRLLAGNPGEGPQEGRRQGPQPDRLPQANPCEEPAGQAWGSNPLRPGGTGLSENARSSHWVDGAAEGLEFGFRQCRVRGAHREAAGRRVQESERRQHLGSRRSLNSGVNEPAQCSEKWPERKTQGNQHFEGSLAITPPPEAARWALR